MENRVFKILVILTALALGLFADNARDIELSRRYVALGKFAEAREILEPLLATNPNDLSLRLLLKQTYRALKDNEALLGIVEAELAVSPNDAGLWIELGEIALASGQADKAKKAFKTAVDLAPADEAKILAIFKSYMAWGYSAEAAELLLSARKQSGRKAAFALEIASIHEVANDWPKAADEYALYLGEYPDRFPDIERRMNEVSADPDQLEKLVAAVTKLKDKGVEGDRIDQMLARLRVRQGDYVSAVKSLIEAESKRRMKGLFLVGFMREALAAGAHSAVITAGEYLADAEPRFSQESNLTMAYSLRATKRVDEAIKTLTPLTKSKSPNIAAEATALLGTIYLEDKADAKTARGYFEEAIKSYPRAPQTGPAFRGLAEVYFQSDDFESAEGLLRQRRAVSPDDPWALFGLGELAFFRGATDTAGAIFKDLAIGFPKSEEANDAVEYLALFADASKSGDLGQIASAFRELRKGELKNALTGFDELIDKHSSEPWADLLLWERAHLKLRMGDELGYRTDLKSISEVFPDGYHAAQALELLGDSALESGDLDGARHYFNTILVDYSGAVNLERVREKLRKMPGNI